MLVFQKELEDLIPIMTPFSQQRGRLALVAGLLLAIAAYIVRFYLMGDANKRRKIAAPRRLPHSSSGSSSRRSGSGKASASPEPVHNPDLPDFIMLMGIPGSGKSTWATQYVFKCDASFKIISSDDIRRQVTGSINDQSRNAEVWEVVLNQVQGALRAGKNVILDATNTSAEKRRKFIAALPPCNRYLKVMTINKTIARQRISRDLAEGIERAVVPDAIIELMYRRLNESMLSIRDEGWMMKT